MKGLLCTGRAGDLHAVFGRVIVNHCKRASVQLAAGRRWRAPEIVVDSGSIVKVQPIELLGDSSSFTVDRLDLGVITTPRQNVDRPERGRNSGAVWAGNTLVPGDPHNRDYCYCDYCYVFSW